MSYLELLFPRLLCTMLEVPMSIEVFAGKLYLFVLTS